MIKEFRTLINIYSSQFLDTYHIMDIILAVR